MLFFYSSLMLLVPRVLASLTYKGVDWSSFTIESNEGKKYSTSSGTTEALQTILAGSGVNTVRQRVWVNPSGGNYNLNYNLAQGKLAHAAGLGIYLDLHFSDTWADPGHQVRCGIRSNIQQYLSSRCIVANIVSDHTQWLAFRY